MCVVAFVPVCLCVSVRNLRGTCIYGDLYLRMGLYIRVLLGVHPYTCIYVYVDSYVYRYLSVDTRWSVYVGPLGPLPYPFQKRWVGEVCPCVWLYVVCLSWCVHESYMCRSPEEGRGGGEDRKPPVRPSLNPDVLRFRLSM